MHRLSIGLVLLGLPALAAAQQTGSIGPIGLPLPSIGLPLPSIGLSLPPIGMPLLPVAGRYPESERPVHPDYQPGNQKRRNPYFRPPVVYVTPYSPWGGGVSTPHPAPPSSGPVMPSPPAMGRLRFHVEPAGALQVFVDQMYVGTPADLGGEIDLPPGTRRIEFRAPGHHPLLVDAQIVTGRTITYRGSLDRESPEPAAAPPPPPPSGSTTIYLIPGCYMGNVPPDPATLPARCDVGRLTVLTP